MSEQARAKVAARLATLPAHRPAGSAKICAVTQSDAADLLTVGRRNVQSARQVQEQGTPEPGAAVLIDGRLRNDQMIVALLEEVRGELRALTRIVQDALGGAEKIAGANNRQIIRDIEISLTGKIPQKNMSAVIARKTGLSERHVRRLRTGE